MKLLKTTLMLVLSFTILSTYTHAEEAGAVGELDCDKITDSAEKQKCDDCKRLQAEASRSPKDINLKPEAIDQNRNGKTGAGK